MTVNNVHAPNVVLAEKCGPLIGTLTAANDQHSLSSQLVKPDKVAGVRAQTGGQFRSPFRNVSEIPATRSCNNSISADLRSVFEGRHELCVVLL